MAVQDGDRISRDPWVRLTLHHDGRQGGGFITGSTTSGKSLLDRCYARSIEGGTGAHAEREPSNCQPLRRRIINDGINFP